MIEQWGLYNAKTQSADTPFLILYDIKFNQNPNVTITIDSSGYNSYSTYFLETHNASTTYFAMSRPNTDYTWYIRWKAIGY